MIKNIIKILISNRGEIALGTISSANKIDISTVNIYSDIDTQSPNVLLAMEQLELVVVPMRNHI